MCVLYAFVCVCLCAQVCVSLLCLCVVVCVFECVCVCLCMRVYARVGFCTFSTCVNVCCAFVVWWFAWCVVFVCVCMCLCVVCVRVLNGLCMVRVSLFVL